MKFKFEGIGSASATLTMSMLAASPLAWLTTGVQGKIVFFLLKWFYMGLASRGLVVLNIGAAKVTTLMERRDFDGSFEEAFRIINEKKGKLTSEEKAKIDQPVIEAFRRFVTFSVREHRDP